MLPFCHTTLQMAVYVVAALGGNGIISKSNGKVGLCIVVQFITADTTVQFVQIHLSICI